MFGCLDSTAFNFDADAGVNTDDGSCIPVIVPCSGKKNCNRNFDVTSPVLIRSSCALESS